MGHLRSVLRITLLDKVTNKDMLERTGLPSMEELLIRKNLRWTGHMRHSPDRLPKQILLVQLDSGNRERVRPRLRYKDAIKRNLMQRNIGLDTWISLTWQRATWRKAVNDRHCRIATVSIRWWWLPICIKTIDPLRTPVTNKGAIVTKYAHHDVKLVIKC